MTEELHAITPDGMMGRLIWDRRRDRLTFLYDSTWREAASSYPLSLSMPLTATEHPHKVVEPFLWGLLPDNDGVLRSWGARFQVSPRHAFQLLSFVGEECAGAVQFVRPDRATQLRERLETDPVKWLEPVEIGERMRLLLKDHSSARLGTDAGQFSLAGAQPKTAFLYDHKRDRWGIPSGVIPTTHIFKPATGAFDGYAENEHFCLRLASGLGMAVASSAIHHFEGVTTIVIRRYDRVGEGTKARRVHQEDMCQALARMPQLKYQSQGGPSGAEIVNLVRQYSSNRQEDEARFIDAIVFNWLICGTDAHAKNYSFLFAPYGQVRLAPLYDLLSALPYPLQINPRKARLAMKIGNKYRVLAVAGPEWERFAAELKIDFDFLKTRILHLVRAVPDTAREIAREMQGQIAHDITERLTRTLIERAAFFEALMTEA